MTILEALKQLRDDLKLWCINNFNNKLNKNLGTENTGKVLAVDENGDIVASDSVGGGVGQNTTGTVYTIDDVEVTAGTGTEIFNDYAENIATGEYSHAEGKSTKALAWGAHAEGAGTIASKYYSHAEGWKSEANGDAAHSEGQLSKANGIAAHAEGMNTNADGEAAHSEGCLTKAIGDASHAEGGSTIAYGVQSHAEGGDCKSDGIDVLTSVTYTSEDIPELTENIVVLGSVAYGVQSHAEGTQTLAYNYSDHAEGYRTIASGGYAHAEGGSTKASALYAHAEGFKTVASGQRSHAEGHNTESSGYGSHSEGKGTKASGQGAHAEGSGTIAVSDYQHVQGKYNVEDAANTYAHIVGNGTNETRSNAHTLDWDGNAWYQGDVYVGGTSQDDGKQLATKEYVDTAILDITVGSMPEGAISWNDLSDKPFGTEQGEVVDVLPSQDLTFTDMGVGVMNYISEEGQLFGFEVGKTYKVTWNETMYECECHEIKDEGIELRYIGDASYFGLEQSTEPFIIFDSIIDNAGGIMTIESNATNKVSIQTQEEIVHQLDMKYVNAYDKEISDTRYVKMSELETLIDEYIGKALEEEV